MVFHGGFSLEFFTNPYVLAGTLVFFGFSIFVLYLVKFNKDPYFPLKPHRKVRVVEYAVSSDGLVFIDEFDAKNGDKGLYINRYNKLLPQKTPSIPGTKKDMVLLIRNNEGTHFPLILSNLDINNIESSIEKILDDLGVKRDNARAREEAKKVVYNAIIPSVQMFQVLSKMYVDDCYNLVKERLQEEYPQGEEKKKSSLWKFLDTPGGISIALAVVVIGSMFLLTNALFEGLTKTFTQAQNDIARATLENQNLNKAVLQWCVNSLKSGKIQDITIDELIEQAKANANKQTVINNQGDIPLGPPPLPTPG